MPTLTAQFAATITQGGQSQDIDVSRSVTVGRPSHEKLVNVAGASSATYQTVWDSSVDMSTFTAGIIILDPEAIRESAQDVDIRITSNSATYIRRANTNFPFVTLGPSAQGTGAITKVEIANKASTTAGTDDVDALIRLWK